MCGVWFFRVCVFEFFISFFESMKVLKFLFNFLMILCIVLFLFLLFLLLNMRIYFSFLIFFYINMIFLLVFLFVAFMDLLDGYIVRSYKVKLRFGEIFDFLVDKIFILSVFLGLVYLDCVNVWILFVILGCEFFILGFRVLVVNEKKDIFVNVLGKYKIVF